MKDLNITLQPKTKLQQGIKRLQEAKTRQHKNNAKKNGIFSVCEPQYVMHPLFTEHVSLHSKSLSKNMARASGGCNFYAGTTLGRRKSQKVNIQII